MKKKAPSYVLLGDVVASRHIGDRAGFDKKLKATVKEVSKTLEAAFELPLQVWKGLDEVAAVLKTPVELYRILNVIQDGVAPEKFRFVLVKGELDVVPLNKDVRQADGDPFHQAAESMQALKKEGLPFSCKTGNALWDSAFSTQVALLMLLKEEWTERQRSMYAAYVQSGRQDAVAAALGVTQQTVSKTLQAIRAAQVQQLERALQAWTKESLNE